VLVVLCAAYAVSAISISYAGNVTASAPANGDWSFRATNVDEWDLIITDGIFYSSLSVSGTSGSISGDAVWAAAYVNFGSWPVAWLAKWDANASFDSGTNFLGLDVTRSSGFLAHSYCSLVEKDPTGKVVTSTDLSASFLLTYAISAVTTSGHLKWITLTGTSSSKWTIALTFVSSDILGVLENGGVVIAPQTLETIVTIANWPYASSANTLSLVMGVATGASTISGDLLVSRNSTSQVYFRVAQQAKIDGTTKGVSVSAYQTGSFDTYFADDDIEGQLETKYGANYNVYFTTVTFPAGANNIEYDPSAGAGTVPPSSQSPACRTTVSILATLFLGLLVICF
jgi:hypothetical protein